MDNFSINKFPDCDGSIAIVTGANSGIGYYTAQGLAQKGVQVILACRNLDKAANAKAKLQKEVKGGLFNVMQLDTSSLASVTSFASEFLRKHNQLDFLINNAGIMATPKAYSEDGFELQFATNYLGHFALTGLLLPALESSTKARIISLSSIAHKQANIYFDDVHFEQGYQPMKAYGQSKLADLVFAYELERRLRKTGAKSISLACHPGISNTNLGNNLPGPMKMLMPFFSIFGHSPSKAAFPTLMAALDQQLRGGEYLGPTGFLEFKGNPGQVNSSSLSKDNSIASRLWKLSETLTGVRFLD